MSAIIIAIDGHSSTGKSTIAKALAKELNYTYVDTGAMYRAVTLYALRKSYVSSSKIDVEAIKSCLGDVKISFSKAVLGQSFVLLNGEKVEDEIRAMDVSNLVSTVSAIEEVRTFLVKQQQEFGKQKAVVMDGRDIGSVVFPDAELKIFMTASEQVRAQRRFDELRAKGMLVSFEEVLENNKDRDYKDSTRKVAPLIKTADALVLDNSKLSPEEQLQWVLNKVQALTAAE